MLKSTEMDTINALVSKMSLEDVKMISERLNMQRTFIGKQTIRTLMKGDRVSFNGRRGLTEGTVLKVNIKNVVVDTGATRWNVPASMLTKVAQYMSLILSIAEAKEKGMWHLVEQLERDLERRQLLKMPPLEDVKEKDVRKVWEEPDDWDDL